MPDPADHGITLPPGGRHGDRPTNLADLAHGWGRPAGQAEPAASGPPPLPPDRPDVVDRLEQQQADRRRRNLGAQAVDRLDAEIPTRYRQNIDPLDEVRAYAARVGDRGPSPSILLLGPTGTGKTHQAYNLLRYLVVADPARFATWAAVPVPAYLESLRPGRDGTGYRHALDASLLVLDDLAAERGSDWTVEVLYRLIDHRWAWELPTIITTNATPERLDEHLGQRITSRLRGMCTLVPVTGEDRRRPPA